MDVNMDVRVVRENGYTYTVEDVAYIVDEGNFTVMKKENGQEVIEPKPVDCNPIREGYYG